MNRTTSAAALVALMLLPSLATLPFIAQPAEALDTTGVPVPLEPVQDANAADVQLHFYDRTFRQLPSPGGGTPEAIAPDCRKAPQSDQGDNVDGQKLCFLSPRQPSGAATAAAKRMSYGFTGGEAQPTDAQTSQFLFDAFPETDESDPPSLEAVQHEFRIPANERAFVARLNLELPELTCETGDYSIQVRVRTGVLDQDAPSSTLTQVGQGGIYACHPTVFNTGNRTRLTRGAPSTVEVPIATDSDIVLPEGHILSVDVFVRPKGAAPAGATWTLVYGNRDVPTHIEAKGTNAIEAAVWFTQGDSDVPIESFNPDAVAESDRTIRVHAAIMSPLGPEMVETQGLTYRIVNTTGVVQDLVVTGPDDTTIRRTAPLEHIVGATEAGGSLQQFRPAAVDEDPVSDHVPWVYPSGIAGGTYTVEITVPLLGETFPLKQTFAMGAFAFSFKVFDNERVNHRLVPDGSTTFLLNLTNVASLTDTYTIGTEIVESAPTDAWSVVVQGVQVTGGAEGFQLEPGQRALLRVRVTPPSTAQADDFARIKVTATSVASGASRTLASDLEAQVQDVVAHSGTVLYLGTRPAALRVGQTTSLTTYVWNQGTATDSFEVLTPTTGVDTVRFSARPAGDRVSGVPAGDIVPVQVQVTVNETTPAGTGEDIPVQVRSTATSGAQPRGTTIPVETMIRHDFDAFVVGATGELARSSLRWVRYGDCVGSSVPCEPDDLDTDFALHEFRVTNTGDRVETFDADIRRVRPVVPPGDTHQFATGNHRYAPALFETIDFQAVGDTSGSTSLELEDVAPGETRSFWLRVYSDNADSSNSGAHDPARLEVAVRVTLEDVKIVALDTTTYANRQNNGFLAIDDVSRATSGSGLQVLENGTRMFLTPGSTQTTRFVVTDGIQTREQVRVSLGPDNLIGDMFDDGWTFELVNLDTMATTTFDSRDDAMLLPAGELGNYTGESYPIEMRVTPPETGLQQGQFFSFTVRATGTVNNGFTRSIGYTAFIGSQFDFELDTLGPDELDVHGGDTVAVPLQITNLGASEDTYDLSVTSPGVGWQVRPRPGVVTVPPGRTMTVAVEASIPNDVATGSPVTILAEVAARAIDKTLDSSFVLNPVAATGGVAVYADTGLGTGDDALGDQLTRIVSPGRSSEFPLVVRNEGDTAQTICLVTEVHVDEFGIPPGTTSCEDFDAFEGVEADSTRDNNYVVRAPDDLLQGSRFPFLVRAQNTTVPEDFDLVLLYAVVEGVTGAELDPRVDRIVVPEGGAGCLNATLRNTGTQNATFELESQFGSGDWDAALRPYDQGALQAAVEPAAIPVSKGQLREVCIEVTPPEGASPGTSTTLDLVVRAQGSPDILDQVRVTALTQTYGFQIELSGDDVGRGGPGEDVTYLVDVTNTGNGHDRVRFSFEGDGGGQTVLPVSSSLPDDVSQRLLEPGETLRNVEVIVEVPPPTPDFRAADVPVQTRVVAQSVGAGAEAATASVTVTTRIVPFIAWDVDFDGQPEVALDSDLDDSNGYEVFRDVDDALADSGVTFDAVTTTSLYTFDADDDGRLEHLVNPQGEDAVYFDPDRPFAANVTWVIDITGDTSPEYSLDTAFDGLVDGVYEPDAESVHDAVSADFKGFGQIEQIVDTDDNGEYDTFVDPATGDFCPMELKGENYHIDSDCDGRVDTFYNAQSGEISEASTSGIGDFLGTYWYFVVAFVIVIGVFVAIAVRRM